MAADSLNQIEKKAQGNKSLFTLIKLAVVEWADDDAATWSAALACYAILALAPLAVLALKVFTLFISSDAAQARLQSIASEWMGGASGDAIREILSRASQPGQGKWAAAISLIIAVVSAGGVLSELQQAMNRIWKVKAKAQNAALAFLKARLLSLMVLVISAAVLLSSVIITSSIEKITANYGLSWKYLTWGIDVVASAIVATLIFGLIYRTLPDVKIEWKTTWVGAGISAFLFLVGKYGLAIYFKFGSPTSAFGAVGSLAAVLIWVYYSCMIIFFGAELTQVFVKLHGYPVRPSKHARWLSECDETETATPSSYEPGQKAIRPYEGTALSTIAARRQSRGSQNIRVDAPSRSYRPAIWMGAAAATTASIAGIIALRRRQIRRPIDLAAVDRIGHEIDTLSAKITSFASR